MKIMFNEACGKHQGEMIVVEADSFESAIEKFGADEVIKPYQKFENCYFSNIYEVYEMDKPAEVRYVVHRRKELKR